MRGMISLFLLWGCSGLVSGSYTYLPYEGGSGNSAKKGPSSSSNSSALSRNHHVAFEPGPQIVKKENVTGKAEDGFAHQKVKNASDVKPRITEPVGPLQPPRPQGQCHLLGVTPSATTCGAMASGLIFIGLIATFWNTRSLESMGFWIGFVLGFVITLVSFKQIFAIEDDNISLISGIVVGLVIGIASIRVQWVAHALSAGMVSGGLIYLGVVFGPFIARKFGNHWWLWAVASIIALPFILFGWKLYRLLAFLGKTALGALFVTIGLEYFITTYTDFLSKSFVIIRLLNGSNPKCHGVSCVLTLCFWFVLTLIGSFVNNFGMVEERRSPMPGISKRGDNKHHEVTANGKSPSVAGEREREPINYVRKPEYNSLDDDSRVYGVRENDPFSNARSVDPDI